MQTFEDATALKRIGENTFSWRADQRWFQGPGAYGGLTLAAMIRAAESLCELPLRRFHAELCALVTEAPCVLSVATKRVGKKTQFLSVEIQQNEMCVACGSAVFGAARTTALDRSVPTITPPRPIEPIPPNSMMPAFTQNFEYRVSNDGFPLMGDARQSLKSSGWIDFKLPTARNSLLVVGLLDAWWPAVLCAAKTPRPMGTVSFTADFLKLPNADDGPFYLEIETDHVVEGYALEIDRLWNQDGELLAQAQQRIAVIK